VFDVAESGSVTAPSPYTLFVDVNTLVPTNQQNGSFSNPYSTITQAITTINATSVGIVPVDVTVVIFGGNYSAETGGTITIPVTDPSHQRKIYLQAWGNVILNNLAWNITTAPTYTPVLGLNSADVYPSAGTDSSHIAQHPGNMVINGNFTLVCFCIVFSIVFHSLHVFFSCCCVCTRPIQ
jgi:hypothetical protein